MQEDWCIKGKNISKRTEKTIISFEGGIRESLE